MQEHASRPGRRTYRGPTVEVLGGLAALTAGPANAGTIDGLVGVSGGFAPPDPS